jgi:hypothetical protein
MHSHSMFESHFRSRVSTRPMVDHQWPGELRRAPARLRRSMQEPMPEIGIKSGATPQIQQKSPDSRADGAFVWSTRPDSNWRPSRWQGDARLDFIEEFRRKRSYRYVSVNSGGRREAWTLCPLAGRKTLESSSTRPSVASPSSSEMAELPFPATLGWASGFALPPLIQSIVSILKQ